MPELRGDFDVIVHSGDLMPNKTRGIVDVEIEFQRMWLVQNAKRLKLWFQDKPVIFCPGNHDFANVEPYMRDFGIDFTSLENDSYTNQGVRFMGFSDVPKFAHEWNRERSPAELARGTLAVLEDAEIFNYHVLVAHCPPWGVLDMANEHIGNSVLTNDWLYRERTWRPNLILSGHCHEAAGVAYLKDTFVSNAACTQRIIDFDPQTGISKVVT